MKILKRFEPGERGYKKQRRADRNEWSTIYFVEAIGMSLIKIGYTADLGRRLDNLLSFCPCPIRVLGEMTGGPVKEQEIHTLFAAQRSHGEWFWACPDIRAYIAVNARPSAFAEFAEKAGQRRPPDPATRAAVRAKAGVMENPEETPCA